MARRHEPTSIHAAFVDSRYLKVAEATQNQRRKLFDINCQLCIYNIDYRVTENTLATVLKRFGRMVNFRFMWKIKGEDAGKPLGTAYVTYSKREEAETAQKKMNGKKLNGRRIVVAFEEARNESEPLKDVSDRSFKKRKVQVKRRAPKRVISDVDAANIVISEMRAIKQKLEKMKKDGLELEI